ncbi:hypothetical protein QWZ03_03690 [Chitinimonas viridis]|uniref:Uncharacterized protein n=1 Tax=Chitinimonas viridis TaxID=664880 RepID=A0ABT8B0V9_9NEIS|nr:hypothetical protein [Chitinimonas viridis]MDN3575873.1 hypothetical protein [Chitinimonas viridis]
MNRHIALQLLLCSSMAQAAITPDQLFDWAEIQYYALFPGNSSTAQYEGYTYRYYPQSNNYLAVKDGDIWVLGTIASSPLKIAPVADYQCQVLPDVCVDNITRSALTHAVTSFSQLFSQGHPSADQLTPLLADDFLHNDKQRSTHIADLIGDADTLGMQFANVQAQALSGDLATVSFDVLDALGTLQERVYGMQLRKINQQWLWLGNQQRFETGAWAQALRHSRNNAAATLSQGLEFSIIDADASNSSDISHAIITGPGLPVAGLTYVPGTGGAGNQWVTTFTQPGGTASITSPYYQINNDTTIQRIPNAAIYQMQFYRADASLAYTYQAHILQRPHLGA